MTTTIHIEGEQPYVEEVVAQIKNLLRGVSEKVKIVVEPEPFDPNKKLTHEELFALPEDLQMQYFKAHGGVFAVMKENGYGLTDADIDDWHRYKEKRDQELAALPRAEALKRIYGKK